MRYFVLARLLVPVLLLSGLALAGDQPKDVADAHRSPVALALSADGGRLLTANQGAGTVSLIDPKAGKVLFEQATGAKPTGVAFARDGRRAVVTHWYGSDLAILDVGADRFEVVGRVVVGPEPRGVALSADGSTAYVAVGVANEVVRVDCADQEVTGRLSVGREPRGVALSPDGRQLLVGNGRGGSLSIVSTADWRVERTVPIDGANLRQVVVGDDGQTGYVVNMRNRGFATTRNHIDLGWVLGQRLTRIRLDSAGDDFETLSLDPQGEAAADVYGLALSPDGLRIAVSSAGTHEIFLITSGPGALPWRANNSRDLIAPVLLKDGRFRRIAVGGRPTELAFAPDGRALYIANTFADALQVLDPNSGALVKTIPLGSPVESSLARRGEIIFHDAARSFNQWYSCATCHADGHTNGLNFDTLNDGWQDLSTSHKRSRKKAPTLRGVANTAPWTWHGWQTALDESVIESFTKSMQGPNPPPDDVKAVVAYLGTLDFPPNPYRDADGSLTPAAQRGETVFRSAKAGCATCHSGPSFTDGKIHDVGLNEPGDVYSGYNPPSLLGVYDKDPYLHDGRAPTLRDALTGDHNPENIIGLGPLSDQELDDLIAYLKSL